MFINIHIIQNFPPHCLNRDDTGAPKSAMFGGSRRGRVSSQCYKRAVRQDFRSHIPEELRSVRTRLAIQEVAKILESRGRSFDDAVKVADALLRAAKMKSTQKGEEELLVSECLLFLPESLMVELADLADDCWDSLSEALAKEAEALLVWEAEKAKTEGKGGGSKKKDEKNKPSFLKLLPDDLKKGEKGKKGLSLSSRVSGLMKKAASYPEIALFGRMIANTDFDVPAACAMAQAISTHRVESEFDYFTAVDDFSPTSEAGMLGDFQFNSSCLYRYAALDVGQLLENLGGDTDSLGVTLAGFLESAYTAIPSAKKNSTAPFTRPCVVLVSVSRRAPLSLADAFDMPADASKHGIGYVSARKLRDHLNAMIEMDPREACDAFVVVRPDISVGSWEHATVVENIPALFAKILALVGKG